MNWCPMKAGVTLLIAASIVHAGAAKTARSTELSQALPQKWAYIANAAQGQVGVAALLLETDQFHAYNSNSQFPMQSVYKLPIGMAILRQVDEGTLSLDQDVEITPSDYVSERQHSPIRDRYPEGTSMTVQELLRWMVGQSDGSACDVLLRIGGGPEQVMTYLDEIGSTDVVVMNTEKEIGSDRETQFRNYATAAGMITLLAKLHRGEALTTESRALLLDIMAKSPTGPRRLKGLLAKGTPVAHKTGTSHTIDGVTAATNDVGIITLPDGRHLAIAVFVSEAKSDEKTRERVIAEIAKATYDAFFRVSDKQ